MACLNLMREIEGQLLKEKFNKARAIFGLWSCFQLNVLELGHIDVRPDRIVR